jgi:hypothetical protein
MSLLNIYELSDIFSPLSTLIEDRLCGIVICMYPCDCLHLKKVDDIDTDKFSRKLALTPCHLIKNEVCANLRWGTHWSHLM